MKIHMVSKTPYLSLGWERCGVGGGGGSMLGASFEVGFSHLSQLLLRYSDRLMSALLFFILLCIWNYLIIL